MQLKYYMQKMFFQRHMIDFVYSLFYIYWNIRKVLLTTWSEQHFLKASPWILLEIFWQIVPRVLTPIFALGEILLLIEESWHHPFLYVELLHINNKNINNKAINCFKPYTTCKHQPITFITLKIVIHRCH